MRRSRKPVWAFSPSGVRIPPSPLTERRIPADAWTAERPAVGVPAEFESQLRDPPISCFSSCTDMFDGRRASRAVSSGLVLGYDRFQAVAGAQSILEQGGWCVLEVCVDVPMQCWEGRV